MAARLIIVLVVTAGVAANTWYQGRLWNNGLRLWHGAAPSLPKSYCEAIDGMDIGPNAGSCGTAACLGMLLGTFMHLLAKRAGAPALARPAIAALNIGAEALDRRVAALREPQPGTIFANYHVVAEVAS